MLDAKSKFRNPLVLNDVKFLSAMYENEPSSIFKIIKHL
jgi:hypothetical protein